jgi:hypothetical protein
MLFALPGYPFPYIVMNRCFYLTSRYGIGLTPLRPTRAKIVSRLVGASLAKWIGWPRFKANSQASPGITAEKWDDDGMYSHTHNIAFSAA